MEYKQYRATGLMSGSSMDGVDLVCSNFMLRDQQWTYEILATTTLPYPEGLKNKLEEASLWSNGELLKLDLELGYHYAALINDFHASNKLEPNLIASHGHTILHDPSKGVTLQAGNGQVIADQTGTLVINDFRTQDVNQGGQGAPLVPVGDKLLFNEYEACINLGGFANISYDNAEGKRIAYDLCPTNMALNWIASLANQEFDRGGLMAEKGKVDVELLKTLNNLAYYQKKPPKSLGREWFLNQFLPLIMDNTLSTFDRMATTTEHIAIQIVRGIHEANKSSLLLTGGGTLNHELIRRIQKKSMATLTIPGIELIDFKEALVFAFLGILKLRGEINCLASVTGGRLDLSAGIIHTPITN